MLLGWVLGGGLVPAVARGADAAPAPRETKTADAEKEARGLFAQGQIHYSLGEYRQAIAQFRRAYELTSAPGLLFNIAQAHRLDGDCKQALEVYRHFVRLAPESPYRGEADAQIAALMPRCGLAPVALRAGVEEAKSADQVPVLLRSPEAEIAVTPAPRWTTRRRTSATLLAGGVGVGLAAGIVYWWNNGRFDDWRTEDQRLAAAMAGTPTNVWLAAQQRNDSLLQSVQRVDKIDLALAGLSLAAVLASAVTLVIFDR
ncbi:MAG TPA: tetratricopeptide repeat protein [Polyangia bacterium]